MNKQLKEDLAWLKNNCYPVLVGSKEDGSDKFEISMLNYLLKTNRKIEFDFAPKYAILYSTKPECDCPHKLPVYLEAYENYKGYAQVLDRFVDYLLKDNTLNETDAKTFLSIVISGRILFPNIEMKKRLVKYLSEV